MADRPVFEWVRPSDKEVFQWRPLTLGMRASQEAIYRGDMDYMMRYALAALRIVPKGGGASYSLEDFRQWEEDDVFDFMAHFQNVEAARLIKNKPDSERSLAAMEKAVMEMAAECERVVRLANSLLAAARAAGPLVQAG